MENTFATKLWSWSAVLIILLASSPVTRSLNILGVFPTKANSHFQLGWALMQGLTEAGHNVTLISSYELPKTDVNQTSTSRIHLIYLEDQNFFTGSE